MEIYFYLILKVLVYYVSIFKVIIRENHTIQNTEIQKISGHKMCGRKGIKVVYSFYGTKDKVYLTFFTN